MKIQLTQGHVALIDNEDFNLVNKYKWYYAKNGYASAKVYFGRKNGKNIQKGIYMHKVIMKPKKGMDIDHINQNKLDNRKSNLRVCNRSQNLINRPKQINNTSGFKGVTFFKWGNRIKRWKAQIQINNKHKSLGYYLTKEEANIAYNIGAKEYFGEFARLNEIEGMVN